MGLKSYICMPTRKLPTIELKRRIKNLTPKSGKASRVVWGSISEYKAELRRRKITPKKALKRMKKVLR